MLSPTFPTTEGTHPCRPSLATPSSSPHGFNNIRKKPIKTRKTNKSTKINKTLFKDDGKISSNDPMLTTNPKGNSPPELSHIGTQAIRTPGGIVISNEIPMGMPVCLRPTKNMHIIGTELAVIAYVFRSDLEKSEILVRTKHFQANRETLMTLLPSIPVLPEVLSLLSA
ncbi:hypothetical protein PIB30_031939 [Stylosanthes scabra]|uniref:Uncharacterized protein n=1 Tax=Stylosanthes scabra TaxID=79078 RepID=A0ABU6QDE9_9FABA|nr:hypothetical protein [Stylosanthes scabra]